MTYCAIVYYSIFPLQASHFISLYARAVLISLSYGLGLHVIVNITYLTSLSYCLGLHVASYSVVQCMHSTAATLYTSYFKVVQCMHSTAAAQHKYSTAQEA